mmetsp:Transcript_4279/g.8914  ORF Transcript_4279/g.8914 Transcript_4279/m.8914 type:complete len:202 (-) Transcript_4279:2757-3362(-)
MTITHVLSVRASWGHGDAPMRVGSEAGYHRRGATMLDTYSAVLTNEFLEEMHVPISARHLRLETYASSDDPLHFSDNMARVMWPLNAETGESEPSAFMIKNNWTNHPIRKRIFNALRAFDFRTSERAPFMRSTCFYTALRGGSLSEPSAGEEGARAGPLVPLAHAAVPLSAMVRISIAEAETFTGMGNMHFKIGNLHDIYL